MLDRTRPWLKMNVSGPRLGTVSGVTILEDEDMPDASKAPDDGLYTLGKGRFKIKKGETLPPGAEFVKAKKEAVKPDKTSRRTRRPAETTAGSGPEETADEGVVGGSEELDFDSMSRQDLLAEAKERGIPDAVTTKSADLIAKLRDLSPATTQ